ncbi:N-acetylmuramic acid 6-phosphate etherase [Paenibacillus sp. NPDC058071]|uniref:N-acetylmuramic acid 6-phosphate etherase n=1 Tax=Paenibacillus sp. NPDC058071 TaxID=3346326 RepID=UPI0036DF9829
MVNLNELVTEQRNDSTLELSELPIDQILKIMNEEDRSVADVIQGLVPEIHAAVDKTVESLKNGGRLIYIGAGTSGRLGVLDASECPPTFGVDERQVLSIIAGGDSAFITAVEGAEDDLAQGAIDLKNNRLTEKDVVVGLTASGRTPYVIGALSYAKETGAATVSISCNSHSEVSRIADHPIEAVVGPEVLTGSTRLKAGTAQKMILNMISTVTMVKLGKAYKNLMTDLSVSNHKLRERARRIVMLATGADYEIVSRVMNETNDQIKTSIVMINANADLQAATDALAAADDYVSQAIASLQRNSEEQTAP